MRRRLVGVGVVAAVLSLAAASSTFPPPTPLPVGVLLRPEMIPLGAPGAPVPGKR